MTKKYIIRVILIIGFISLKTTLLCQTVNDIYQAGTPFIEYYGSDDYQAHNQNFGLCFDDRNFLYLANFAGAIEYDGHSWQLFETLGSTRVTAIAYAQHQGVFVGGIGEAGIITRNGFSATYHSLDIFNDSIKVNDEVIAIFNTGDTVLFITKNTIFTLEQSKVTNTYSIEGTINKAFYSNNKLYIAVNQQGLFVVENEKLVRMVPPSILPTATAYTFVTTFNNKYVIGTARQGILVLDEEGTFYALSDLLNDELQKYVITDGIIASSGELILGTLRSGLLFIDPVKGRITNNLTRQKGFGDNGVYKIVEYDGLLWCVLNNGITSINISSPFRFLSFGSGLEGIVNKIEKYNNEYYAATYQGLFHFNSDDKAFISSDRINMACWDLIEFHDHLFVATSNGLINIHAKKQKQESDWFSLSLEVYGDELLLVGGEDGIHTYSFAKGKLSDDKFYFLKGEEIIDINSGISNIIMAMSTTDNIYIYEVNDNKELVLLPTPAGLPHIAGIKIIAFDDTYYASTSQGSFKYIVEENLFQPFKDQIISQLGEPKDFWVSEVCISSPDTLWTVSGDETHSKYMVKSDSGWIEYGSRFVPIENKMVKTIYSESEIAFLGGANEIILHNSDIIDNHAVPSCYIRKCILSNDSILFDGGDIRSDKKPYTFHAKQSDIKIYFASPLFAQKKEVLYSTFLEGKDEYWHSFTPQVFQSYSNLPKGLYTFYVKAKDGNGEISDAVTLSFRVLPEWYNTLVAYIIFILAGLSLVFVFVKWRARRLQKEKDNLEEIVKKRTEEISMQKNEISQQSKQLSDKNSELERINILVRAINSEIHFQNLLQSLLVKMSMIQGTEVALALVKDDSNDMYQIRASYGMDTKSDSSGISFADLERTLLANAKEIGQDIFVAENRSQKHFIEGLPPFMSCITIIIKNRNTIDGMLVLGSLSSESAFPEKDHDFILHAQEHIISAFIKTRILYNLESTLADLQNTQQELIRQEKLASVGQLTKGIVDRVINPLNYIINFATLSGELNEELIESTSEEREKLDENFYDDIEEITTMLKVNLDKIEEHGNSASRIIKGMERLLKDRSGEKRIANSNQIIEQQINIITKKYSFIDADFVPEVVLELSESTQEAFIIDEYFAEAIQNILDNAFDNMHTLKQQKHDYSPRLEIKTTTTSKGLSYTIRDNGTGIPEQELPKIFNPFYTTKPTSKGSGVGLYITHEIIENFNGIINVNSKLGEFTEFQIVIPNQKKS